MKSLLTALKLLVTVGFTFTSVELQGIFSKMRHSHPAFAFLRTEKDRWAFAEGFEDGFQAFSSPPEEGDYFWAPDFFLEDKKPFLKAKRLLFLNTAELRETLQLITESPFAERFPFEDVRWMKTPKKDYEQTFFELKTLIEKNRLEKAVPVVIDQGELSEGHLKERLERSLLYLFDQMAELPETLFPFFLTHDEWMFGATPETLLLKKEEMLFTHAVAGTTSDPGKNLLNDEKERSEHLYVANEIEHILSGYGEVFRGKMHEKILPQLKHLVTDMKLRHMDVDFNSVIEIALALHPTPALGGYPKGKAFEWLKSLPHSKERRRYGAPFGYVSSSGESHIVVAIRSLQLIHDHLLSIAGGGVVKESLLEPEWNEIQAKKNSVLNIFSGSEFR